MNKWTKQEKDFELATANFELATATILTEHTKRDTNIELKSKRLLVKKHIKEWIKTLIKDIILDIEFNNCNCKHLPMG